MKDTIQGTAQSLLDQTVRKYPRFFSLRSTLLIAAIFEFVNSNLLVSNLITNIGVDIARLALGIFLALAALNAILRTSFQSTAGLTRILTLNAQTLRGVSFLMIAGFAIHSILQTFFAYSLREQNQFITLYHAGIVAGILSEALYSRSITQLISKATPSPGRKLLVFYAFATLVGTYLLILPFSLRENASLPLIDSVFTTVSALTVTGLSTVNISETFNLFGQSVLLVLIQIGGLGIIVFVLGISALMRTRSSIKDELAGRELYGVTHIGNLGNYLIKVISITLGIEALGAITMFAFFPADQIEPLFTAIFHAVSAFCNAGFSTLPSGLEMPGGNSMKVIICILIMAGSIGYPVIIDFANWITRKGRGKIFSNYSILTLYVSGFLWVFGAVTIALGELFYNPHEQGIVVDFLQGIFYSISGRTAGFNINNVAAMSFGSQLLILVLMVIGGSPMSVTSGIKTTTVGIVWAATWSFLRGYKWIQFRNCEIPMHLLQKSIAIIVIYFTIAIVSLAVLLAVENHNPWALTFEAISALSTVGLSLGITSELSVAGKFVIMFMMLAGRLGILTIVYASIGKRNDQRFRYASSDFFVG